MSQAFSHQVHFPSPDHTRRFAENLSTRLRKGDVILLQGGIGAGKTHFARSLIQALQVRTGQIEDVPSPTFTLVQTYDLSPAEVWHADLYRLTHPDEVEELGLTQAFQEAICLVEWPDRLGDLWPDKALLVYFTPVAEDGHEDHRVITFEGDADTWRTRVLKSVPA
ncbi:tRNA (adenosine(37)-N6)-threonylcarbamoyltransferase complex ATPase subunit type 1 TsaE [Aliiroseovarius sp. S2029]|uniref:tRNA (adenosine(37)-N6)-threonylcarbamoyltransferase complex ATPase subunit type 1 TsaE n=1 Tax=Aliiroseovarius sp. S2029 TaxID=2936988 RepID=UPI0020C107D5|nr:tRNA (adenosine(37)-N6)-threonylcarbamoyltransferase complex ATPase subunit type 1 TsaE [Aliiroseovarius sp. S2029]MCK8484454.1 tRNA (adenosine(37)-N6)-threonylcarbamoyltransferase complex ATPase subunit type 1 TsaE [Aliiroseovarius sp. S2029]